MVDCQHWMTFEQPPIRPKSGTWIPFDGPGCPVDPRTVVRARLADGYETPEAGASEALRFDWSILGKGDDITHYMIVEEV